MAQRIKQCPGCLRLMPLTQARCALCGTVSVSVLPGWVRPVVLAVAGLYVALVGVWWYRAHTPARTPTPLRTPAASVHIRWVADDPAGLRGDLINTGTADTPELGVLATYTSAVSRSGFSMGAEERKAPSINLPPLRPGESRGILLVGAHQENLTTFGLVCMGADGPEPFPFTSEVAPR